MEFNTFKVCNLSAKLTKMKDENLEFYGVDPKRNLIYLAENHYQEFSKVVSINWNNEIAEEILMPELSDYVTTKHRVNCYLSRGFDGCGHVFFNGSYWILKVNPEDVDIGKSEGIIAFNRNGEKIGEWLHRKERDFISINEIHFLFPSDFSVNYKIVDKSGRHADFGVEPQGLWAWHARMFCMLEYGSDGNIYMKDSCVDFYYAQ